MKWILTVAILILGPLVFAQGPTVDHYALGVFAAGATTPAAPPLSIALSNCNAAPPVGWPQAYPPFVLTVAPITSAKIAFDDPINLGKVCLYDIFVWLNATKGGLAPGPYASRVQWVATDGSVSPWFEAGSTGFLKPGVSSLPAVLTNLRILR